MRPRIYDEKMKAVNVMLEPSTIRYIHTQTDGSVSKWIRKLVLKEIKEKQNEKI